MSAIGSFHPARDQIIGLAIPVTSGTQNYAIPVNSHEHKVWYEKEGAQTYNNMADPGKVYAPGFISCVKASFKVIYTKTATSPAYTYPAELLERYIKNTPVAFKTGVISSSVGTQVTIDSDIHTFAGTGFISKAEQMGGEEGYFIYDIEIMSSGRIIITAPTIIDTLATAAAGNGVFS